MPGQREGRAAWRLRAAVPRPAPTCHPLLRPLPCSMFAIAGAACAVMGACTHRFARCRSGDLSASVNRVRPAGCWNAACLLLRWRAQLPSPANPQPPTQPHAGAPFGHFGCEFLRRGGSAGNTDSVRPLSHVSPPLLLAAGSRAGMPAAARSAAAAAHSAALAPAVRRCRDVEDRAACAELTEVTFWFALWYTGFCLLSTAVGRRTRRIRLLLNPVSSGLVSL